ncbi:MAG TPA: isopentenyl-diphosphate Delta-isomerase [Chitinophagaceae bacterium]|nr:isopentenyl-diphosphate Delta-isomerase [Chitinophagaceae bacterium]
MKYAEVILVDENDKMIGALEKMEAHRRGILHRAFSIFIFNSEGEMLLQRRAREKYHSGGLWTNACCSHPVPGEEVEDAACRRLQEELGFSTHLKKIFDFRYKAEFENGLTENEFDHVFVGNYDGEINHNKDEVMGVKYMGLDKIDSDLSLNPDHYTAWFRIAFPKVQNWAINNLFKQEKQNDNFVK